MNTSCERTVGQAFLLVVGFLKKCMRERQPRQAVRRGGLSSRQIHDMMDKQEYLSYHQIHDMVDKQECSSYHQITKRKSLSPSHKSFHPRFRGARHSRGSGNRAPEMVRDQGGGSPPQTYALRFEADCNCVPVREGGEQQKANGQSVTKVNSIRPTCMMSQLIHGEIQTAEITAAEALNAKG